jgi:hypothetical protein
VQVELSLLLILEMTDWACTVKHEAFSEKKEWRIITYPKDATLVGVKPADYEGVSVRPTARLLLPYMILESSSQKRLPLLEIRCGPSQFQEQSARAMNILLRKHGYRNLPVTLSRVPLRVEAPQVLQLAADETFGRILNGNWKFDRTAPGRNATQSDEQ